jgi:hypothetical protein
MDLEHFANKINVSFGHEKQNFDSTGGTDDSAAKSCSKHAGLINPEESSHHSQLSDASIMV